MTSKMDSATQFSYMTGKF